MKFRRLLAVIWHCWARIYYKIRKHYSTRFGRFCVLSTNYRESIYFAINFWYTLAICYVRKVFWKYSIPELSCNLLVLPFFINAKHSKVDKYHFRFTYLYHFANCPKQTIRCLTIGLFAGQWGICFLSLSIHLDCEVLTLAPKCQTMSS